MVFSVIRRLDYLYGVPSLDNFVFKLCYRWTVLLLVVFSFIITYKLRSVYTDSYCASAHDPDAYAACNGAVIFHKPKALSSGEKEEATHYLNYYSWVNLVFLVQAFIFYLPHLLWKSFERGYVYMLAGGIQKIPDKEKREQELSCLAKYICITRGKYKLFSSLYILFEFFNFVIALSLTFWLVRFFNVVTIPTLAFNIFNPVHAVNNWSDFKDFYFPRDAYCSKKMKLCTLPLNELYMKMYLILNVWYIIITVLTALMIVYRILIVIPSFRILVSKLSPSLSVESFLKLKVHHKMSYSDWFFMSKLRYVMTDADFAQMINKIEVLLQGMKPQRDGYEQSTIHDGIVTSYL